MTETAWDRMGRWPALMALGLALSMSGLLLCREFPADAGPIGFIFGTLYGWLVLARGLKAITSA